MRGDEAARCRAEASARNPGLREDRVRRRATPPPGGRDGRAMYGRSCPQAAPIALRGVGGTRWRGCWTTRWSQFRAGLLTERPLFIRLGGQRFRRGCGIRRLVDARPLLIHVLIEREGSIREYLRRMRRGLRRCGADASDLLDIVPVRHCPAIGCMRRILCCRVFQILQSTEVLDRFCHLRARFVRVGVVSGRPDCACRMRLAAWMKRNDAHAYASTPKAGCCRPGGPGAAPHEVVGIRTWFSGSTSLDQGPWRRGHPGTEGADRR